jgi:predicted RND superfamily exporter protein/DNA replication protein DnaC
MSRRPLRFALTALIISALGAVGMLRFAVDAGESLLVGATSSAGQTYAQFSNIFGGDPIVLVFTAHNPTAPYIEKNLERLGALEVDLAHDPRVASVLGPGTVAGSLREAAVAEVSKVLTEYPYFIAETDYVEQLQKGNTNQQDLQTRTQTDISNATSLLELYVVKAASDAHNVRSQYTQPTGAQVIDSREKAVDAAVAKDPAPPLWAEYLAGPGQTTNPTAAQQFFAQVASSYGDCDSQIATLLKITTSCQVFFERTLLDLPHCPQANGQAFCSPKPQWSAVLPTPAPDGPSYEVVTIRLKPQYANDQSAVSSLRDKINNQLAHGIGHDAYTKALSSGSVATLNALGPLDPTECGGATAQQNPACSAAFHDAGFASVIAGAPLLGLGVANAMSTLLAILIPVALFVMLLLLVAVFRVRGRAWPLLAAGAATVLTIGGGLLTGTPITPAVLAGVPVLIGLGVDYAVQLVARFSEERSAGADAEEAVRRVISNTAHATLIAAVTTLAGLAALALVSGIDAGPLAAVPLVAEFSLVLCAGVVLAWLGGLFVALPLAVWSDRRGPATARSGEGARSRGPGRTPAGRTLAIADSWRGVVGLATVLALFGWAMLRVVPVQTDVQQLLASSLPELNDIQTVQAETGYTNEVDIYLHGDVATGPIDAQTGSPASVEWQCSVASLIRSEHADTVGQATSIGDYVIASSSGSSRGTAAPCVPATTPGTTPSPSPSPTAGATPSSTPATSASPSAVRGVGLSASGARLTAATVSPAPTPLLSAAPSASASSSAAPSTSPSASPKPSAGKPSTQTRFLCDLRLFPALSRTLVMTLGVDTVPCPPIDEYQQLFLATDATPISPTDARIAIGVHTASIAEQAKLIAALRADVANPPKGLTATPTGLAALAATAYDNLVSRAYLLNVAPLVLVGLVLLAVYRQPRRALLPLLPTALAAGWAPLVLLILGRLPGDLGTTLGSLNPLTVVLGALIVALGTEFGVVLLSRFYEERRRGLDPREAAAAALDGVGKAIRVSALTLGAGFGVLAISGLFPNSLPLVSDFGLAVVIDLALAILAVFAVMLPLAVALEQRSPLELAAAPVAAPMAVQPAPGTEPQATVATPAAEATVSPASTVDLAAPAVAPAEPPRRKRPAATPATRKRATPAGDAPQPTQRMPVPVSAPAALDPATAARLAAAGFPVRKSLEDFRVETSSVPAATVADLAGLGWVDAAENVCLIGPSGTGKSHLLIGLANAAVTAGHSVRYFSAEELVEALHAGLQDNSVGRVINELLENDVIVIDDLGFAMLDERGTQLLFRFVAAAYERRSLLVASQVPLDRWAASLSSPDTGASLVERLLHHAVVVTTEGESFRVREARARRGD